MQYNKHELKMLQFLHAHPNKWLSVAQDKTTLRALAYLLFTHENLEYNKYTKQMRFNLVTDIQI